MKAKLIQWGFPSSALLLIKVIIFTVNLGVRSIEHGNVLSEIIHVKGVFRAMVITQSRGPP